MKEVFQVAEVESFNQLQYERLDVFLCKLNITRVQQTHQVMVTVFKH